MESGIEISGIDQGTFLLVYERRGYRAACAAIHREPAELWEWANGEGGKRVGFLKKWHKAKVRAQMLAEEEVEGLTGKAIEVVRETLEQKEDARLRYEAASGQLKGRRYWRNRVEMESRNVSEIRVTLVVDEPPELKQPLIEARGEVVEEVVVEGEVKE